jgi:SAM-dependent methyltransferase
MTDGPSFPTDYDDYAPTYAWSRSAVPWIVSPLSRIVDLLPADAAVLEIGCGTGNYIRALAASRPELGYFGFDLSEAMLQEARGFGSTVAFIRGDAAKEFPVPNDSVGLAFAVDIVHHIDDLARFFAEAHRVLLPGGCLLVVTDSEDTLRRRSLTRFFPEILAIERLRYPTIARLDHEADRAGLRFDSHQEAVGRIPLDDEFLGRLEAKCASAMRLITTEQHTAGMARVRAAGLRGEQWLSCYDVVRYVRSPPQFR